MKRVHAAAIAMTLLAPPLGAEEDQGLSLMERGAQMFLEGILKEMEPAIDEFSGLADEMAPVIRQFADEMGPRLSELMGEIEDWSAYEAPQVLPNGDIIIRRKPDTPMPETTEPAPQIDL